LVIAAKKDDVFVYGGQLKPQCDSYKYGHDIGTERAGPMGQMPAYGHTAGGMHGKAGAGAVGAVSVNIM